jgi:hypothetical protein
VESRPSEMDRIELADALDDLALRALPAIGGTGAALLGEAADRLRASQEMRDELADKVAEIERLKDEIDRLKKRMAA